MTVETFAELVTLSGLLSLAVFFGLRLVNRLRQGQGRRRRRSAADLKQDMIRGQLRLCRICGWKDLASCDCWFSVERKKLIAHKNKQSPAVKKLLD